MDVIEISAMSPLIQVSFPGSLLGLPRLCGWSEQVGETVNVSESIFSETLSRKRRRLAGGGEWTEWSSAEQSWDEEEQTPES